MKFETHKNVTSLSVTVIMTVYESLPLNRRVTGRKCLWYSVTVLKRPSDLRSQLSQVIKLNLKFRLRYDL